jgi:hypothetical protein
MRFVMTAVATSALITACGHTTPQRHDSALVDRGPPRCNTEGVCFRRAVIDKADVEQAITYEKRLAPNYRRSAPPGQQWFEVVRGSSSVLVVAGHATAQTREGSLKWEDGGTGSLAVMLSRLACTTTIHTTYASPSDPNYYDDNEFKARLASLLEEVKPALVLDLHASHPYRPYDVDFGTMGGKSVRGDASWLLALGEALRQEGLSSFSQDWFGASKNQTVTKFVSVAGVPVVQLELNSTWMLPRCSADGCDGLDGVQPQRFAQLLQGLVRFVRDVDLARGKPPCRPAGG